MEDISPKYIMNIIDKLEPLIWEEFKSYKNVKNYIKKWHWDNGEFGNYFEENFRISYKDDNQKEIDLNATLHDMSLDVVLKIAIDLGIETPDFIPCIPTFKNELKENYKTASNSFDKAFKQIEENPDLAIGLANTTLESIVKHIISDESIGTKLDKNKTLFDLTEDILKEFKMFPSKESKNEIRQIGNGLLKSCQGIEGLRSTKTLSHGKTKDDYIVDDPIYAYFVVNSVSTIGLFLMTFYTKKYKIKAGDKDSEISIQDLQF